MKPNACVRVCARGVESSGRLSPRADFPPESSAYSTAYVSRRRRYIVEQCARSPLVGKASRCAASDTLCRSAVHPPFRAALTARVVSPDVFHSLTLVDSAHVVFLVAVCFRLSRAIFFLWG